MTTQFTSHDSTREDKREEKATWAGKCAGVRNNTVLSAKTTKTQNTTLLGPELTKTFSCKEWLCHLRAQPSRPPNTTDPRPSGTRGATHAFQTTNSDKSDFLRLLLTSVRDTFESQNCQLHWTVDHVFLSPGHHQLLWNGPRMPSVPKPEECKPRTEGRCARSDCKCHGCMSATAPFPHCVPEPTDAAGLQVTRREISPDLHPPQVRHEVTCAHSRVSLGGNEELTASRAAEHRGGRLTVFRRRGH